jgi:uncharacterized protein YndB with AHSA1/START domain
MGYVSVSSVIHAPAESVWNALNDIDRTPDWVVGLEAAEIVTEGDYGHGSIYHDHNRLGPFPQVTPWHVTVFDPMAKQVHKSESTSLPTQMTLNLSPAAEGTHLQMIVEYRLLPRLGVISQLFERLVMNRLLAGVVKQNQANLDQHLRQVER